MTVKVPFQKLLAIVKTLTPSQKATLMAELSKEQVNLKEHHDFIPYLLDGPVYEDKDVQTIEENRKSIATWRAKTNG